MARHFQGARNLAFRCCVHELSRLHKPDIFVIVESHISGAMAAKASQGLGFQISSVYGMMEQLGY